MSHNVYNVNLDDLTEREKRTFEHFMNKKWGRKINQSKQTAKSIIRTISIQIISDINTEIIRLENQIKKLKTLKKEFQEVTIWEI